MDLTREAARSEAAEAQLNTLIERRARKGEVDPDEQEELWKESVRIYNEKRRQQNRWEWIRFFERLARALHARADDYQERASKLLEEVEKGASRGQQ